jgi:alanine racemase
MKIHRREFLGMLAAGGAASTLSQSLSAQASMPASSSARAVAAMRRGDPWLEISKANLIWNFRQIQSRVGGKPVMAVIKANAYGHGLVGVARTLEAAGAKHFLVGKLNEALELRNAGLGAHILNFGPWSDADAADLIRLNVSQTVYTDQVQALDRAARRLGPHARARVHIKVDTGLGRFGVPHDRAFEFLEQVAALRSVTIEGVFTTFTEDPEFDGVQLSRLKEICTRATQRGFSIGLSHAASSDAICEFPAAYTELDMVRPGIMLYGLFPSTHAEKERKLDLKPALSLKARVAYVKTLRPGESVSYHRAFTASQPERIATLAVGYSDGFPRTLAGKGAVLISARRCPILSISANAIIVRLGDTPAANGDEVVLLGAQGDAAISASEVADLTAASVYNVVIGMGGSVPQVYV